MLKISFMEACDSGQSLYTWPVRDDVSWEDISQVLLVLSNPELVAGKSTNRKQVFAFNKQQIEKAGNML